MTEPWPPDENLDENDVVVEGWPTDPVLSEAALESPTISDAMSDSVSDDRPGSDADRLRTLEREGDVAADYLEGLLDIADFDGDIDMDVEGDRAMVSVVGADLEELVGADGQVLEALQELTRLAVVRQTGERSRLMLDISGFRARKRVELTTLAEQTVREARTTGVPVPLAPMTPFERKVVHDAVAAAGLHSESEGEEPERFVVVLPN
jgi:spoIIIJ-associated protein